MALRALQRISLRLQRMTAYDAGVGDDDVDMRKWVCHICGICVEGGEREREVESSLHWPPRSNDSSIISAYGTVAQLNDDNNAPPSDK